VRNIRLVISYDGSRFYGWQRQKKSPTVQETLEKRIKEITGEEISLAGCGRTDRGVHAISYVANFKSQTKLSPEDVKNAINSAVAPEILVKKAETADVLFHSRYGAKKKIYRYLITGTRCPFLENYACFTRKVPDRETMRKAAVFF